MCEVIVTPFPVGFCVRSLVPVGTFVVTKGAELSLPLHTCSALPALTARFSFAKLLLLPSPPPFSLPAG